ncbi:hypothetical protein SCRM01_288 [Synechococcus phage S-CRM01]|nr:hypothetical protein SCRM01_288 [Synechococcus phage S-CRM01]AEC53234.1 hypothetical protein SCRM01_288 [Synechococcus phage S-CRM01]
MNDFPPCNGKNIFIFGVLIISFSMIIKSIQFYGLN